MERPLASWDSLDNYAALHFTGGADAFFGKSLRIQYIANVLKNLGFDTILKGDLIEASLTHLARPAMEPRVLQDSVFPFEFTDIT